MYFSKYANIKLGKPDEKPEFNDVTWFMMLFACGIGVGLFFYGVAEPIYHYTTPNRYSADSTMPDNTLAQIAINVTLYHWGNFKDLNLNNVRDRREVLLFCTAYKLKIMYKIKYL